MATALILTLKDPKYMNWIRAGLGLLIVKRSISPATMRIIEDFHRSIGGVPTPLPGATASVTPAAAAAVVAPGCSCTFKDIDFKKKCMKTGCTICNPLVQLILAAHKFPTIYKDNCDPCKWSTDPWEVGKAFMGPGQQKDNHGPEQTDCSNLVLLWNNCSHLSTHISDKKLLKTVREARNAGMHSPKMTLSDTEMKSAFESMINLLQDATLSNEPDIDASSAVSELEKVRDQGMSILPEDELNVWLDQIKALNSSWEQLKTANEPVAAFLQNNPGLLERISQEWPKLQGRVVTVEQGLHQVKQRLHHEEQGLQHVEQKVEVLREDFAGMKTQMESTAGKDPMALLQELRQDLAESYLTGECSRTQPISSLCKMLPVKELLVPVSLTRTKRDSFCQGEENERSIETEAILSPVEGDSSSPKRILVEGEPGRGKSMLCKGLALSWAQDVRSPPPAPATRQDTASQSLPDSGTGSQPVSCIGTPAQSKREASVTPINAFLIVIVFTVNTLIGGGVADNLLLLVAANWKSHKEEISEYLEANCKQVLLIFDGFDEASSPQPEILTKILDGRLMKGCTIITTSRPGFCGSTFDVSYRLEGFNMKKRESYVTKFFSALHYDPNNPRQQFLLQRLQSTGTIANLCETPLFLVLVCLISTTEKNALPDRRTDLYEQFDDFIHDEAVKRYKIQPHTISYLREVLQRVAYTLLMDNSSEITVATIHCHSSAEPTTPGPLAAMQIKQDTTPMEGMHVKDVMTRLCHVGFLAQSQQLQGLKTVTKAHFIHQSFVDYFAAKHVTSSSEEQQTTLIEQLFKHTDIFHNVFVIIAGLTTNTDLLAKLLTQWQGAMAAEQMPSFNSSDLRREMERMGKLTWANHALHHAPLGWLAETTAACSALQVLASHMQLKAISLIIECTETCLTAVKALCKAAEHQPTPWPLYLGLHCYQFKACDVLALFQKAALTRGAIEPVYLCIGLYVSAPVWTEAECRLLAALLAQFKQIRKIGIKVRGCSALEMLSHGLTADAQLQELTVDCHPGDDDGSDHSLPEFLTNIKRLMNIKVIQLWDYSGSRMSDEAERELYRWVREQTVMVGVVHN